LRRLAAFALVLLCAGEAAGADEPVVRVRADGMLLVTLHAGLLGHRDVRRQLTSGLTTTFLVTVHAGDRKGGARVEVRYEPWDEVYFVTARGIDAAAQQAQLADAGKLADWWRSAALPVLPRASPAAAAQVTVEVLPFSIEEQKETQRWLSRSLGEAHRQQGIDESEVRGSAGTASVLDVLIGTSIQRRPLVRFRWSVAVTR
jgi:hypothetical protein